MGAFDDQMKEKNYTIQDIMTKKIPFAHTESITCLTRTKIAKLSSSICRTSIFNVMLSLIFGIVYVSATAQKLTTHVVSNHQINNLRYGSTWDINQLFEFQRERQESYLLSDEELQVKLASQLMSLCFVRIKEMANIDLTVSIIDDQEQRAAVCIPPKQSRKKKI
ncbi:MAG: hypothetical protein EZS28_036951 [Streblomastix strix]|uniref:Tyr recombinase domain-containing protein n=1 Tax=Streblomastix strix TaxID=222440 RepID=A0A5J4UBG5_9EUKA|nr:MAG: hypothetical protein EZS28_036951 [Streblomastix strix]